MYLYIYIQFTNRGSVMLLIKKDDPKTPWGIKFEGGEGTGKPLVVLVSIYYYDQNSDEKYFITHTARYLLHNTK